MSAVARRSQEQRSASTKTRLLQAAFDVLVELGYARTTTTAVCTRSGVSRGALLHHYPTRDDLLAAAVEYVFNRRLVEYRDAARSLPPEGNRAAGAIELLWSIYSGPTYYAWLELLVAARTEPSLLVRVRSVMDRFGAGVDEVYDELFPERIVPGLDRDVPMKAVFAVLNGLALDRIHTPDADLRRVVDGLVLVATNLERLAVTHKENR